jgi:histone H3/H4
MKGITKPSLTRLARRGGVKSLSDDCFDTVRNLIGLKLENIIETIVIVNSSSQTKIITLEDVYKSFHILNCNITESNCLSDKK